MPPAMWSHRVLSTPIGTMTGPGPTSWPCATAGLRFWILRSALTALISTSGTSHVRGTNQVNYGQAVGHEFARSEVLDGYKDCQDIRTAAESRAVGNGWCCRKAHPRGGQ